MEIKGVFHFNLSFFPSFPIFRAIFMQKKRVSEVLSSETLDFQVGVDGFEPPTLFL